WQAGRITSDEAFSPCAQEVQIQQNSLRSTLSAKLKRGNSVIRQQVSLDKEASSLRWELEADWLELGDHETIPQLAFSLNHIQPESGIAGLGKDDSAAAERRGEVIRYDIPFGIVRRSPKHMDVPALSWAARELGETTLQLTARGKHAFRCEDTMTRLALLRSSSDPDPYPEFGEHSMQFTLSLFKGAASDKDLISNGLLDNSDLVQVTHGRHAGYLPAEKSFVSVDGPVLLSSLKKEEDGDGIIMRLYEAEGEGGKVSVCLFDDAAEPLPEKAPERVGFNCREAVCTDVLEKRIKKTITVERSGNIFTFQAEPRGIYTLIFSCS
ncbi:MAG: hypothetical protein K9L75_03405, partial [Spirochaetia bacterium]|nr:hypothetical protein [Spirochaetia bacterium]